MELQHFGGRGDVAVAHDGARTDRGAVAASTFRSVAVVDGASWPSAPVGVVGAKVVSQFVGHHVQVPRVAVDVGARAARHGRAEAVGEGAAVHAQPCNAAGAGVPALRHQVGDVALNGVETWRAFPRVAKAVQHATCVVDEVGHGVRRLPEVHVARLEQDQTVELLRINGGHSRHLGQGPVRGVGHVVVRQVREVVYVDGHLHASTVHALFHLNLGCFSAV